MIHSFLHAKIAWEWLFVPFIVGYLTHYYMLRNECRLESEDE